MKMFEISNEISLKRFLKNVIGDMSALVLTVAWCWVDEEPLFNSLRPRDANKYVYRRRQGAFQNY